MNENSESQWKSMKMKWKSTGGYLTSEVKETFKTGVLKKQVTKMKWTEVLWMPAFACPLDC